LSISTGGMRRFLLWVGLSSVNFLFAQPKCGSFEYQKQLIQALPSLEVPRKAIENFVFDRESLRSFSPSRLEEENVITIPVVVHLLYHYPGENISDDVVHSQIFALNRDYRKLNSDTIKIPGAFKPLAADCEIEFKLATVDASGRATTGIVRKYTPVTKWTADDKIKSSSEAGDDPWDAASYLNIWVGTMDRVLGYSSTPGDPASKDGVVISNTVFGITNSGIYDQGRTAVHEVGHWLGLRHLWGDTNCGDDGVADTPPQQTFTNGCPSTVRISCNNGPNGDMYMDYMDFTNDDCLVMFTHGQKQKMRTLFEIGGPRHSILLSKGLDVPAIAELPLPDNPPQWLQIKIFPNPATTQLTINMEYDERWVGKQLQVIDMTGKVQIVKTITSKVQKLDVSQLAPGVYFLKSEKTGEKMMQKFIKL
jgi:type IX secretion system substrate protein/pregnancy-associated plasma protein-A